MSELIGRLTKKHPRFFFFFFAAAAAAEVDVFTRDARVGSIVWAGQKGYPVGPPMIPVFPHSPFIPPLSCFFLLLLLFDLVNNSGGRPC